MADGAWGLSRAPPWEAKAELGKGRTPFSSSPDALPSKCTKDSSSGGEANSRGAEAVDDEYIPIYLRLEQGLSGDETESILIADIRRSNSKDSTE